MRIPRLPLQSLFEQRNFFGGIPTWPLSSTSRIAGPSKAGVLVTESSAEGVPSVYACVRVLSNAVAQLPLKLLRIDGDSKVEATDNPLMDVLDRMANPEMTAFEFRATMMSHLLLWGNAYGKIDRNPSGQVIALWPLLPWMMNTTRDDRGRLIFQYGSEKWPYDPAHPQILRLSINSPDGIVGRSVVRILREAIGGAIALQTFGNTFFGNGTAMGGFLETEHDLDPQQRAELRADVDTMHRGADRANRFMLLYGGMKYKPNAIPPEDAQFLESKKFSRSEIAGAFGVPPHLIGDLERATFSNIENESIRFLRDGLEPHLRNFEEAISRDCLGPRSYSQFDVRFTRNAMVRGDLKSRADALAVMRQNGIISANQWRALEELDPIPAAAGGDQYLVSSQSKPLVDANNPDASSQPMARTYLRDSKGVVVASVTRPISREEARQAEDARSRDELTRYLQQADEDNRRLNAEHRQSAREVLELRKRLNAALEENRQLEEERESRGQRVQ